MDINHVLLFVVNSIFQVVVQLVLERIFKTLTQKYRNRCHKKLK